MEAWWKNWWTRPHGGRAVLIVALPLIISHGSWQIMHFCDRLFLWWHDETQMAASLPSGLLLFTLVCFPLGVASYANAFVGQYQGAGHTRRIGLAVWQGVMIAMIAFPAILATGPFVHHVFALAGHEPLLAHYETTYYRISAIGAGAMLFSGALSAFFSGRGKTWPIMFVGLSAAGLNIGLDYLMIFGCLGFPEMGIAGAALATSIAQWYGTCVYWFLMHRGNHDELYGLRAGRRFCSTLFVRFWRYGGPAGLQFFIELAAFAGFVIIIGRIGSKEAAATSLAFNMNGLSFIPMVGMGIAVTALVGQCVGAGRPQDARRVTWTALALGMVYTGFFGISFLCWPNLFLLFHAWGVKNAADFEEIRPMIILLMRFIAFYCVFDCLCAILAGTLKGAGDTRYIFLVSVLIAPAATIFVGVGVFYFNWGLVPCWWIGTLWVILIGLAYLVRFLGTKWEHMRVIEPDLVPYSPAESGAETNQVF